MVKTANKPSGASKVIQGGRGGGSNDGGDSDSDSVLSADIQESTDQPLGLCEADAEFNKKKFLKLLCNKFPSKYIKSKYANFDENTSTFGPHVEDDLDAENEADASEKVPPRISILMAVAPSNEYAGGSGASDDEDADESDNITVSSVSSISSISDISDISSDESSVDDTSASATTPDRLMYARLKKDIKANPKSRAIKKAAFACKKELRYSEQMAEKYELKQRAHNKRLFERVIQDNNLFNDKKYFKRATTAEQKRYIKDVIEINNISRLDKPYRIALIESAIPLKNKSQAMKRINLMETSEAGTDSYNKNKQWVDNFMRIPFNCYIPPPITAGEAGVPQFIIGAKKILDETIYGMEDAKMQIMQMIGQLITNPLSVGTAIGVCGPPGVGKSTLIKDGVSKILGRPFSMITLGGATDGSFLDGHSYTYEGSVWGRLVQILIESKCMNPIIYFGELDKISGTARGNEIIGILTHLTDSTQNMQFHDKYFADVDFDFSKAIFIFDYNDETAINPILRDRLYKIHVKEYTAAEKQIIATDYLIPRICTELKFAASDVVIPKATIALIIDQYCGGEKGVRNLKRALETIYRKINLIRLMVVAGNDTHAVSADDLKIFGRHFDVGGAVSFPYTVTPDIVAKLIERPAGSSVAHLMMYV